MTKRVAILIYILIVLALSGMSRASETVPAVIKSADILAENQILRIVGHGVSACQKHPQVIIKSVNHEEHKVVLDVQTSTPMVVCRLSLPLDFVLLYDLRVLPVKGGENYQIVLENDESPAAISLNYVGVQTPISNLEHYKDGETNVGGILKNSGSLSDGRRVFIIQNEGSSIPVIEMGIDLSGFVDKEVEIQGYKIQSAILNSDPSFNFENALLPISLIYSKNF